MMRREGAIRVEDGMRKMKGENYDKGPPGKTCWTPLQKVQKFRLNLSLPHKFHGDGPCTHLQATFLQRSGNVAIIIYPPTPLPFQPEETLCSLCA